MALKESLSTTNHHTCWPQKGLNSYVPALPLRSGWIVPAIAPISAGPLQNNSLIKLEDADHLQNPQNRPLPVL
jgi:hypothetical protein